ncbi:recombinase RecA [bacterium]|nr:recombinase RecA [bacterium]
MPKNTTAKTIGTGSDKELAAVLADLDKKFGKGTLLRGNERPDMKIDVFPTGSMGLDRALGVGGYPRGRIVEIYGPEGSGKCLTGDTLVWTTDGVVTIAEMFERNGMNASCTSRTTEKRDQLINRHGRVESTTHFTHNNRRAVFTVSLEDGSDIRCTANHPHLVMNSRGSWVWKKTGELATSDVIVKLRGTKAPHTVNPSISDADAYALGALIADGAFTTPGRISFTNNDPALVDAVTSFMASQGFSVRAYPSPKNNTTEFHFNGRELVAQFVERFGLANVPAAGKTIPYVVRTGGMPVIKSFLRGYIDCEAWLATDKTLIEISSASYLLVRQVQNVLLYCGVQSVVRKKTVTNREEEYWTLNISGPSVADYISKIGFSSAIRQQEAANFEISGHSNIDLIPNIAGLLADLYDASETTRAHSKLVDDYRTGQHSPTYKQLEAILQLDWTDCAARARLQEILEANYVYVPVSTVTLTGEEPTFDFAMRETHSFIANGVVTHNTTLTLHAIAEAQKAGLRTAFIDAEHALDPAYATRIGVNMDELFISQPDSGEQALEIAETLARSGAFHVIVVDSVAALVPQAELNGDMGDSHVGLQARLMSQALRKLTSVVSKTHCTLFFINQIRMKIGVMFGNPETTTGGNALKFYSSVRLEVRKAGNLKHGDEVIGSTHKVKVVKNKVAPPFRECVFEMRGGNGIDFFGELVDHGVNLQVIEKSGAWYSFEGERVGQGRENSVQFLRDNPAVAQRVEAQIRSIYEQTGASATAVSESVDDETGEVMDLDD